MKKVINTNYTYDRNIILSTFLVFKHIEFPVVTSDKMQKLGYDP